MGLKTTYGLTMLVKFYFQTSWTFSWVLKSKNAEEIISTSRTVVIFIKLFSQQTAPSYVESS